MSEPTTNSLFSSEFNHNPLAIELVDKLRAIEPDASPLLRLLLARVLVNLTPSEFAAINNEVDAINERATSALTSPRGDRSRLRRD